MPHLLIIYHSRTGAARQMAEAAFNAAQDEIDTRLLTADQVRPDDLLTADGFLFCAPENLATVSGQMKEFFDRCYYPCLDRIEARAYALMVAAGSDGHGAASQMTRIATGWRLREVQPPLIVNTNAQTPETILAEKHLTTEALAPCRDLGQAMGAGLAMGVF